MRRLPSPAWLPLLAAVLWLAPAAAEDLVSPSYRLRGLHVATTGPAWLASTAASPSISVSGVSVGQPHAIGYGLVPSGLEATWTGFWPLVVGAFPNHDLDADGLPSLTDLDDDGDGVPDAVEVAPIAGQPTDPLDPDTDDDEWSDGEEALAGTDPLDPESHPSSPPGPPAVPGLQGLGVWLMTAAIGLIGITRLRKRRRT